LCPSHQSAFPQSNGDKTKSQIKAGKLHFICGRKNGNLIMLTGYQVGTMRAPLRDLIFKNETWSILRLEDVYAENTLVVGGLIWSKLCRRSMTILDILQLEFCLFKHLLAFEIDLQLCSALSFCKKNTDKWRLGGDSTNLTERKTYQVCTVPTQPDLPPAPGKCKLP
jgi:hypothetical protein